MSTNLSDDLTIGMIAVVLAGLAIAASSWDSAAHVIQLGLVLTLVVLLLRGNNAQQFVGFFQRFNTAFQGGSKS